MMRRPLSSGKPSGAKDMLSVQLIPAWKVVRNRSPSRPGANRVGRPSFNDRME